MQFTQKSETLQKLYDSIESVCYTHMIVYMSTAIYMYIKYEHLYLLDMPC